MKKFVPIVLTSFFLSVHYGAILYLNSTLLGEFFSAKAVSLLFVAGALGNLILFLFSPRLIKSVGKHVFLISSLIIAITSIAILYASPNPYSVALAFLTYSSFFFMNYYCLDIFLEEVSSNGRTGEIRGIYLTLVNLGIALGPLVLLFLGDSASDIKPVYFLALLLLIPSLITSIFFLRSGTPKWHHPYHLYAKLPFKIWWHARNIRQVTIARFILETFYAFMFIYIPIYLHTNIGFAWAELGIMFAVMLIPFIIFEWPAGEVADRYWGEKEMLSAGFILIIITLVLMPYIGKSFLVWTTILFISRVGASLVEIMTESYFFKQISAKDTAMISIFRIARPAGVIFGAVVGAIALSFIELSNIFFVLAILVFLGLKESLFIKDTR